MSIIKKVVSIFTLSVFSIALFYVLFSPLLIAVMQPANPAIQGLFSFISGGLGGFQTALAATSGSTVVSVVVGKEVSITAPANFTLTGTINGISGGTASGTAGFTILNSSQSGFNMSVYASASPALATGAYNFTDYSPNASTGTPDFNWTAPSAGATKFGFAVGADASGNANQKFKYSGSACNASGGTNSSNYCYSGFNSTTPIPVVSTSSFSASNVTENIILIAQFTPTSGTSIAADTYKATITATVSTN